MLATRLVPKSSLSTCHTYPRGRLNPESKLADSLTTPGKDSSETSRCLDIISFYLTILGIFGSSGAPLPSDQHIIAWYPNANTVISRFTYSIQSSNVVKKGILNKIFHVFGPIVIGSDTSRTMIMNRLCHE